MLIIDSHAHLDHKDYKKDLEIFIKNLENKKIYVISPSVNLKSIKENINLSKNYKNIFIGLGFHPHDGKEFKDKYLNYIKENLSEKVIAIGEIGLDFYYNFCPKEIQKEVFLKHINLAKQLKLPMIIHTRQSHLDLYEILKKENYFNGVIHSFTIEDKKWLYKFLDLNFYIGINGIITFKKAKKLREIVRLIPLDKLLLETDSPYLTPIPYRGKRNSPEYIIFIAKTIAKIKNIDYNKLIDIANKNAIKLFNLKI